MPFLTSTDKALWRLALPMIFSNITVPLLGLVDTAVIGHLDSPVYLGGVAVGATATSFLFMLLLFLRMSTTGLTAQAFGARDPAAQKKKRVFFPDYRAARTADSSGAAYYRRQRRCADAGPAVSGDSLAQRARVAC
ncbi:DNA-damage-inducible protein F [Cronobacter universalis NCTC 9529]|nr:DNA-damage-inducible protein F [Cronobacter universalis NCTC 9529]